MNCKQTVNEYFEDNEALMELIEDSLADFEWDMSSSFDENVSQVKEQIDVFLSEQAFRLIFDEHSYQNYSEITSSSLSSDVIQRIINQRDKPRKIKGRGEKMKKN